MYGLGMVVWVNHNTDTNLNSSAIKGNDFPVQAMIPSEEEQ